MRAWLAHHRRGFSATLGRIARTPLGSALNILVIGIALSLPLGLYVALDNVQASSRQLSSEPQISAFIALDASRTEVAQIDSRLKQDARVQKYRFVPRDQALQELKQASGLADIVDSLPRNPLPDAFVITARGGTPQALEALRDEIEQWPRVAHVQLDAAWARRLDAIVRLGRLVVTLLAGLLAVALVAVAFNTIRLQILTQREEIEVARLIGATDAFIRRPFLYFGAFLGVAGGIAGWLIVAGGVWLINHNLGELSRVYATLFRLQYLDPVSTASVLVLSAALGWFGAWLSVDRNLAGIAPLSSKYLF